MDMVGGSDVAIVQYQLFFKTVGMMNAIARSGARFLPGLLLVLLPLPAARAQEKSVAPAVPQAAKAHDGQTFSRLEK